MRLSRVRYERLVSRPGASFRRDGHSEPIAIVHPTDERSMSFEANGRYSLVRTCNDWVREALTAADVRMPLWSPFDAAIDAAIIYQLRRIRSPTGC